MKINKVKVTIISFILLIIILLVFNEKRIFKYFIDQATNPSGPVGYIMTKIWNNTFDSMSKWGINNITLAETDILLDVGCGGGQMIYTLATNNAVEKIYGIDISSESVKSSSEKNKSFIEDGIVNIELANVQDLPYEKEMFNVVTAIQTHFYWDDLNRGLSEIYRVLKQDGKLVIICENDKIEYHLPEYKESEEMKNLLDSIGFVQVQVIYENNWIEYICQK